MYRIYYQRFTITLIISFMLFVSEIFSSQGPEKKKAENFVSQYGPIIFRNGKRYAPAALSLAAIYQNDSVARLPVYLAKRFIVPSNMQMLVDNPIVVHGLRALVVSGGTYCLFRYGFDLASIADLKKKLKQFVEYISGKLTDLTSETQAAQQAITSSQKESQEKLAKTRELLTSAQQLLTTEVSNLLTLMPNPQEQTAAITRLQDQFTQLLATAQGIPEADKREILKDLNDLQDVFNQGMNQIRVLDQEKNTEIQKAIWELRTAPGARLNIQEWLPNLPDEEERLRLLEISQMQQEDFKGQYSAIFKKLRSNANQSTSTSQKQAVHPLPQMANNRRSFGPIAFAGLHAVALFMVHQSPVQASSLDNALVQAREQNAQLSTLLRQKSTAVAPGAE